MSFLSYAKHIWEFEQTLEDSIGTSSMVPVPYIAPSYLPYIYFNLLTRQNETKYGIKIDDIQKYGTGNLGEYISGSLTVSFWYYSPSLIGYTRHAITRDMQTKQAPLISSMIFNTDNEPITGQGLFSITEIAENPSLNKIRFTVLGASGLPYVTESIPYGVGLHHVLATFSEEQSTIRVDIDGKHGISVPCAKMSTVYALNIQINDNVADYSSHITRQTNGFISDLLITETSSDSNEAIRIMRYGWRYVVDSELSQKKFVFFGFSFPQQTAVSSNKIVSNGGNIYVVRSNGEIMQGSRPIWDNSYQYPDADSLKLLTISEQDYYAENAPINERTATWTSEGLRLKGTSVKI